MEAGRITMLLREKLKDERIFLDVRRARCDAWERFLIDDVGACVARPSAHVSALSTDGGIGSIPRNSVQ